MDFGVPAATGEEGTYLTRQDPWALDTWKVWLVVWTHRRDICRYWVHMERRTSECYLKYVGIMFIHGFGSKIDRHKLAVDCWVPAITGEKETDLTHQDPWALETWDVWLVFRTHRRDLCWHLLHMERRPSECYLKSVGTRCIHGFGSGIACQKLAASRYSSYTPTTPPPPSSLDISLARRST